MPREFEPSTYQPIEDTQGIFMAGKRAIDPSAQFHWAIFDNRNQVIGGLYDIPEQALTNNPFPDRGYQPEEIIKGSTYYKRGSDTVWKHGRNDGTHGSKKRGK